MKNLNNLEKRRNKILKLHKREWIFAFFGTAIGAGILFLPLQAGQSGFVSVLLAMAVAFPITYYSNKYLMVMCLYADDNISLNSSFNSFVGRITGNSISIAYFIMLLTVLLAYGIGLNTDIAEVLIQYKLVTFPIDKTLYFPFIILVMFAIIVIIGEDFLLRVLEYITILLSVLLFLVSVLLMPYWHLCNVTFFIKGAFWKDFLLVFPLISLAATYFPAVSPSVGFFKRKYTTRLSADEIRKHNMAVAVRASLLLTIFITFFLVSSIFAMPQSAFAYANARNVSILAAVGHTTTNHIMSNLLVFIGICITILALASSYYGVLLGIIEILTPKCNFLNWNKFFNIKNNLMIIITIVLWLVVITNWSIVNLFGLVIAPIIGITVFCMPTFIIFKDPKLKKYRNIMSALVFLTGIFLVVSFITGLLIK